MVIIILKIGHRSLTLQPTPHQHLKVRSGLQTGDGEGEAYRWDNPKDFEETAMRR